MRQIRYNAARGVVGVVCKTSGLVEANYSGPLCVKAFDALRDEMMHNTSVAPCAVVRLDRALLMAGALPEVPDHHVVAPPAVLIVRNDQLTVFQDYARKLAAQGIMRLVVSDSRAAYAYEWALRRCPAVRPE